MRSHAVSIIAVGALIVTACTGPDSSADSSAESTALLRAMDTIDGPTGGVVQFGDSGALRELSEADPAGDWGLMRWWGIQSIMPQWPTVQQTLGIDLEQADYAITVNHSPGSRTVVAGGQDAQAIRDAALNSGWEGDPVLRIELDLDQQVLSSSVAWVEPDGSNVAFGGPTAHPEEESDPASAEKGMHGLASCLGDVAAATLTDENAAGVRVETAESWIAVVCVPGDAQTASEIEEELTGTISWTDEPYADVFPGQTVTVEDGYVQVQLSGGRDRPALILQLLEMGGLFVAE
ncbi:MAG: hypothetical protein ACK5KO_12055 [Arachnia sp.]